MPETPDSLIHYRGPMATDMHEALARLKRRWSNKGIELLPPATPAHIHAVFKRLGAVATPDVIALYTTLGGMSVMDEDYLQIWSLEDISKQDPSDGGVVFADYLISCWEYHLVPSAGPCSAVRGSTLQHHTGPTLEAFLISLEAEKDFLERYR